MLNLPTFAHFFEETKKLRHLFGKCEDSGLCCQSDLNFQGTLDNFHSNRKIMLTGDLPTVHVYHLELKK